MIRKKIQMIFKCIEKTIYVFELNFIYYKFDERFRLLKPFSFDSQSYHYHD